MIVNLSDEVIEKKANELRNRLGMGDIQALDMEYILDLLPKTMKKFSTRNSYAGELDPGEAFMECETGTLILSGQVADELRRGDKRARFTIAHEIGHYLLGHSGNTKRTPDKSKYLTPIQKIQEQQADLFASFMLVPTKLALFCESPEEIKARFQINFKAATIAFDRVQSTIRKEKGEKRRPVATVVNFLKEAERHGYKIKSQIYGLDAGNLPRNSTEKQSLKTDSLVISNAEYYGRAIFQGYTGNVCIECFNFTMVRDGNCERCNTCGASSGCS
jgi:Zn-dependent peptidase ImmA (M78 family)